MTRLVSILFVVSFMVACGPKTPTAKVVDYGVYDAVVVTSGKWKFGIPVTIASVTGLKHQQTVTRIPLEDGRYWGLRALVTNPSKDRTVVCRTTVDHPEFTAPDGTKSSQESAEFELSPGESMTQDFLWFFIEGCEHEFVPGTWTRRIYFDDREVIRKDFEMYKP